MALTDHKTDHDGTKRPWERGINENTNGLTMPQRLQIPRIGPQARILTPVFAGGSAFMEGMNV